MQSQYFIFIFFTIVCLIPACTHTHVHEGHDHGTMEAHGTVSTDTAYLTPAQVEAIGLETGNFEQIKMSNYIRANGTLDLPPDEFASVTAPAQGFVKSIRGEVLVGSAVKKGTLLASLEHPDFIKIQQDYLEVLARQEYLRHETERQKTLSDANAGALKNYQQAVSDLKIFDARAEGMRQQLQYLGIKTTEVEAGRITPVISLLAPISGFISEVNIHRGQFVEPNAELYEIVSNDHIHLELDVFESDIPFVREGQRISFTVPSLDDQTFEGEVELISKSFDKDNKTVRIHGHILGDHPRFIRGLYIEAKIWADDQTVDALPALAIVTEGKQEYVFAVIPSDRPGFMAYQKIRIRVIQRDGEHVQISAIDPLPQGAPIVTKQAYFIAAEMQKETFEHSH